MAVQVGATCLEKERGGKGVLLGGVPGHAPRSRRHPRRRRRRPQRRDDRGRHGRAGHRARRARRDDGVPRGRLRRRDRDALLEPDEHRGDGARAPISSSAPCSSPARRRRKLVTEELVAQDGARAASSSTSPSIRAAASRRAGPTTHDHPTYEVRRRRALLRRQHAGRRPAHEHLGAHEHDHSATRSRSPTAGSPRRREADRGAAARASTRSAAT